MFDRDAPKLRGLLREANYFLRDYLKLRASRSETDLRLEDLIEEIDAWTARA